MLYDLFICHASDDKDSFVRPLAEALKAENAEVWYDEFSLELGDSIRRSIDAGLRQSRFGVVVLSRAFFDKQWTQYELDGLTAVEMRGRDKVLLPIWHGVSHDDVLAQSPSLANRVAVSTDRGLAFVVEQLMRVVRPQGSPLVAARDMLLEWGVTPPVITDEFWLDVVEASNRLNGYGASIPEDAAWGRWSFPLPGRDGGSQQRGERLAWTALQMVWSEEADRLGITPLTPPCEVLDFIDSQPGLRATCEEFPLLLIEYAPQLSIPGMSGDFDALFSEALAVSIGKQSQQNRMNREDGDDEDPEDQRVACDEEWSLRHVDYGGHDPITVAGAYFSGGMFGPHVSPYEHYDHVAWLLSRASDWLPRQTHETLIDGMANWPAWLWSDGQWKSKGSLGHALLEGREGKPFKWSAESTDDALHRFAGTIELLGLPDTPQEILDAFIRHDFPGKWIKPSWGR